MITVGITGRSGCGKSTVTACFAARGVPVADADQISRQVLQPAARCWRSWPPALGRHFERGGRFGPAAAGRPGLCHPRGQGRPGRHHPPGHRPAASRPPGRRPRLRAALCSSSDGAVLVGSVIDGIWDRLIVVTAPYEVSVARIVARDGIRPEMARRRLDAQLPEAALAARADFLLANDGTQEQLRRQAGALAAACWPKGKGGPTARFETAYQDPLPGAGGGPAALHAHRPAPDRRTALPLPLRRRVESYAAEYEMEPAADLHLCAHRKQL